ncbi:MAG: hypothetical protein ABI968_13470 [Acidobacteriota bacterium]
MQPGGLHRTTTAKDQVFGRIEAVEKDLDLLLTKHVSPEHGPQPLVRIWGFTAGYSRDFALLPGLDTRVGADVTMYAFPSSLDPVYGSTPVSVHGFLRFRWGRHDMHGMDAGSMHHMH